MIKSIILTVFFLLIGNLQICHAQLVVDRGRHYMRVQPGEQFSNKLSLKNTEPHTTKVKIYMEDFVYKAPYDGGKEFFPAGTLKERSNSEWFNISPKEVELKSGESVDVSYTVHVPEDAKGGYHGVMIFEDVPPEGSPFLQKKSDDLSAGLKLVLRVGSLFFIETENSLRNISFENFVVEQNTLKMTVSNQGDVLLICDKGSFYIMDSEGMVVLRKDLNEIFLPQGEKTTREIELKEDFKPGDYTVVLTLVDYSESVWVREVDIRKEANGICKVLAVRE